MIETIDKEKELQNKGTTVLDESKAVASAISDPETYQQAADYLQTIKGFMKVIDEYFEQDIKKAFDLHRSLTKKRKDALEPLENAEKIIKSSMQEFAIEQQRKARIEQERLLAEQKKQAEEAKLSAAQSASDAGEHDKADAILDTPVVISPVVVETLKAAGTSVTESWDVELVRAFDVVKAVVEGKAPISIVQINLVELKRLAKMHDGKLPFGGVRTFKRMSVRSRAK